MKRMIINDNEVIIARGEELKPIAKSIYRHLDILSDEACFPSFIECPKFTPYKIYGLNLHTLVVYTSDVLIAKIYDI